MVVQGQWVVGGWKGDYLVAEWTKTFVPIQSMKNRMRESVRVIIEDASSAFVLQKNGINFPVRPPIVTCCPSGYGLNT